MRKTKLIPLPNQIEIQSIPSIGVSQEQQQQQEEGCSLVPQPPQTVPASSRMGIVPSSTRTQVHQQAEINPSNSSPPTMDDFMSFNRITFNANVQQPRPVNQIHEEIQRQRNSQSVRDVPIIRSDLEFGYLDEQYPPTAPSFDQLVPHSPPPAPPTTMTIPRQLGRRSDQSPRIVSINAESNTIVIHNSSSRPTSAPARVGLVQRGGEGGEDMRRSVRDNRGGGGREFDSMSSVASSRNASPVSLVSSSGSSMTSAARNQDSAER